MVEATLESTFSISKGIADTAVTADGTNNDKAEKKRSSTEFFQDAITINIPVGVTADLGVALRRTRAKRIAGLYRAFPSLKKKEETKDEDDEEEDDEDDEEGGEKGGESSDGGNKKTKKAKKMAAPTKASDNIPRPQEYGSVLDYLEAKYVRGVMIHDEPGSKKSDDGGDTDGKSKGDDDDDDEGQGSVYSETSFLDDRDLQRDVAEQVLAQTTTTKLELDGDDEFFVNVGDLDVEETELTQHTYDPLEDSPKKKTKPAVKKRKKPSTATPSKAGSPAKKKKKKAAVQKVDEEEKKKGDKKKKATITLATTAKTPPKAATKPKAKKDNNDSDSSEDAVAVAAPPKKSPKKSKEELKKLQQKAKKYKDIMEKRFNSVKKMIKELKPENLPRRRPSKSKVSITCPENKKEGDEVTFANPHIPGQRLRVNVPKGTFPGETFKVTVPVPKGAGEDDDGTDHNKFPRRFQDELDIYAREWDEYCLHEGEYKHALDGDKSTFAIHLEKRKKYDRVVKEFPKNLMSPIDVEYMKKLVRRARQNKSKRSKTAANRRQSGDTAPQTGSGDEDNDNTVNSDNEVADPPPEETPSAPPTHRTLEVPQRGFSFPKKKYNSADFVYNENKSPTS